MDCFTFKLTSVLIYDVQLKNNRFQKKIRKKFRGIKSSYNSYGSWFLLITFLTKLDLKVLS